jgi:DNA-binding transcriptional MocR family regulator
VTVQRALTRLAAEGAIEAHPGRGTFVRAQPAEEPTADFGWQAITLGSSRVDAGGLEDLLALPAPGAISLAGGFPEPALLPTAALAAAVSRAARRPSAWTRIPTEGLDDLRGWFARAAGGHVAADDVLVTAGAQSALATIFRALGRPGDEVIVEAPTYIGALAAVRSAGLTPVPVATDGDGVRVDYLEETLARSRARLIVLQPTHANPYGGVLSEERRTAVLELAERHEAFVIEDEYARDLTIDGAVPATLVSRDRGGYAIQIRSLSKSTAPGLRVAAVVSRGPAAARLRTARIVDDFFVSGLLQHTALEVVTPRVAAPSTRAASGAPPAARRARRGRARVVADMGDPPRPARRPLVVGAPPGRYGRARARRRGRGGRGSRVPRRAVVRGRAAGTVPAAVVRLGARAAADGSDRTARPRGRRGLKKRSAAFPLQNDLRGEERL